jgi:hypothetical protein
VVEEVLSEVTAMEEGETPDITLQNPEFIGEEDKISVQYY